MPTKWSDEHYVTAYRLARQGLSQRQIGGALGVSARTFDAWKAERPAFKKALEDGRGDGFEQRAVPRFEEYVYGHLPEDLKDLWDEIYEWRSAPDAASRAQVLLRDKPDRVRQYLFLQALLASNWNPSKALRMVGVSHGVYQRWRMNCPEFMRLCEELKWHRDNFFEDAFMQRIQAGDTACILHAARTQLAHRGYSDKVVVEHTGAVEHQHTHLVVDVGELDLPVEVRQQLLHAIRAKRIQEAADGQLTD